MILMYSRAYFPPPVAHSRLVQQTCDRLTGVINSKTAEHFILHQVPVIYRVDSRVFGMIGGRG